MNTQDLDLVEIDMFMLPVGFRDYIDKEVKAVCIGCSRSDSYRYSLTEGKVYSGKVTAGIFETSPYFEGIGDNGKGFAAHLHRFRILKEPV